MITLYEQIAGEISVFRQEKMTCEWNKALHFCQIGLHSEDNSFNPSEEDYFLYEVLLKQLLRGKRPFCSYFLERKIIEIYGNAFSLAINSRNSQSIQYIFAPILENYYNNFRDIIDPWQGELKDVVFDPEHPDNERTLFHHLIDKFGRKLAHCLETQAEISNILPRKIADDFLSQRTDFCLTFPNGRGLIIEPGDHGPIEFDRDKKRDEAFNSIGFRTIRPGNKDIGSSQLYKVVEQSFKELKVLEYLETSLDMPSELNIAANYLFLLPSLVARVERILLHFFLRKGLLYKSELNIGIKERDLECAEITVASFCDRLQRLMNLYGIDNRIPEIRLFVQRNPKYRYGELSRLNVSAEEVSSFNGCELDLILDVGIKCSALTKAEQIKALHVGIARQSILHNQPVRFGYISHPRAIYISRAADEIDDILSSYAQDIFRKYKLREGQGAILRNVLSQISTIGLLPTSAGKSLCYQLAAFLTPGTTIVVDPIVALMNDQVQSLVSYGIDRIKAWYASTKIIEESPTAFLSENAIIFISPERLQRGPFRNAMEAVKAADIYINYAVIDEAHCVSMWGHDFRPSYLTLERNFTKYFAFQGHVPVIVALTGTASQLVLIDLKRELKIERFDAIVQPRTFDRPELNFNLVRCKSDNKKEILGQIMTNIARRLNVQRLEGEADGIIYAYTPKELWDLFGKFVGDAKKLVSSIIIENDEHHFHVPYGMYTGKSPADKGVALFSMKEWESYKRLTLDAFRRGQIKMLFGNNAVAVGIDNERLNYIINYRMPQSMEAYYQQCGRAGRSGQNSYCYLMFSDDNPLITEKWLNRQTDKMPKRWDDLGIVSYFHSENFPGVEDDTDDAYEVLRNIFSSAPTDGGFIILPAKENDKTERYISYWYILGVVEDYEIEGMNNNTVFHVFRHKKVEQFISDRNEDVLREHIINNMHEYLNRYRPVSKQEIEDKLANYDEDKLSKRCIRYLIDFIYSQIEYQRREAIRTMVNFCNQEDRSPEKLRTRIKAYFDSSEKFSKGLSSMAQEASNYESVLKLIEKIDGFDDVEALYWETRRLLDERYRPDWTAANLYSIAYRMRGRLPDEFLIGFDAMVKGLEEEFHREIAKTYIFISSFIFSFSKFDEIFGQELGASITAKCFQRLYMLNRLKYIRMLEEMPANYRAIARLSVANMQIKEITDARYSRCTE